jgi:hypothetical protein
MKVNCTRDSTPSFPTTASLALRLLKPIWKKFRSAGGSHPRLELVERIALAPRQSLSLVEADGRLLLVATSAEGGPAFYPLDRATRPNPDRPVSHASRVSW